MTRQQGDLDAFRCSIEIEHLSSDLMFLRRLFQGLADDAKKSGIAAMCSMSFICLIAHEVGNYLKKHPTASLPKVEIPSAAAIAQSRHAVKLFDDNKRELTGVTGVYEDEIVPRHSRDFLRNTWLPWARLLESDLGIFTYENNVVGTTHSVTYGIGMSVKDTPIRQLFPAVRSVATELGVFVSSLTSGMSWPGPSFLSAINLRSIKTKDVRADRHYRELFDPSIDVGLTAALESFQASLNFLDRILALDPEPASAAPITKLKFITLWHVHSSLNRVREVVTLASDANAYLDEALGTPSVDAPIIRSSAKGLRNTLVHYGLESGVSTANLSLFNPMFGLIEAYHPGETFHSFRESVDRETLRVAEVMNRWSTHYL